MDRASKQLSDFNRKVIQYQDECFTLAYYLTGDDTLAGRAVQQAILKTFQSLSGEECDLRVELYRWVIYFCKDISARTLKRPKTFDAVWNSIYSLKVEERLAIVLIDILGLTYEDAALAASRPVQTLGSWLAQARCRLASELAVA